MSDDTTQENTDTAEDQSQEDTTAETGEVDLKAELDKWKSFARKHEEQAKANAAKATKYDELEEQNKTEQQKASEELDRLKSENKTLSASQERLEVALDKAPEGMSIAQVRKLAKRLSGDSREELETDADELFAEFAPSDNGSKSRRPKERLRGGSAPEAEKQPSGDELANAVLKRERGY